LSGAGFLNTSIGILVRPSFVRGGAACQPGGGRFILRVVRKARDELLRKRRKKECV
jgi:hypothetical protein